MRKRARSPAGAEILRVAYNSGLTCQKDLAEELGMLPQTLNGKVMDGFFTIRELAQIAKVTRMTDAEIAAVIRKAGA